MAAVKHTRMRPIRPSDVIRATEFLGYRRRDLIHGLKELAELRPGQIAELLMLDVNTVNRELRGRHDWDHLREVRDRIAESMELEKTEFDFTPGVTVEGRPIQPLGEARRPFRTEITGDPS